MITIPRARPEPGSQLLSPANHALLMIDHQPQMAFATRSIDAVELRNNVGLVAHSARLFEVPTLVTTVAEKTFAGPVFEEIAEAFPAADVVDRTTMNTWEDRRVTARIDAIGRDRLVMCGLWTSVCVVGPVLSALDQGYAVHVVADCCGDVSGEAHERAMQRMIQAGAHPMTSLQYLLELQRDWARADTYDAVVSVAKRFGGAYGLGLLYAKSMFAAQEGR